MERFGEDDSELDRRYLVRLGCPTRGITVKNPACAGYLGFYPFWSPYFVIYFTILT